MTVLLAAVQPIVETTSRDAFLVVYAVLWAASTPSFARMRLFTTSRIFADEGEVRRLALKRFLIGGILIANISVLFALTLVWWWLPEAHHGFWGIFGGGLAGLSVTGFTRIIGGVVASDRTWSYFYSDSEWRYVLEEWEPDRLLAPGSNSFVGHFLPGVLSLIAFAGVGILIARLTS